MSALFSLLLIYPLIPRCDFTLHPTRRRLLPVYSTCATPAILTMENNAAEILLVERRQAAQERNANGDIRQYRGIYRTRLVLRILSFATCIAIEVLLANSIRLYMNTKHVRNPFRDGSGTYPVWPENLKLFPSYALLGAALVAGLFSLLLIIASFHKSVGDVRKNCEMMLTVG